MQHVRAIGASVVAGLLLLAAGLTCGPAQAQNTCAAVEKTIASGGFIPRTALKDWTAVLPCLENYLASLATYGNADEAIKTLSDKNFIWGATLATTAMRAILDDNGKSAAALFQRGQTLRTISVLALAAMSDAHDARVNATVVLANVIDATTICVPEDYLYYGNISDNGRANLLALVSIPLGSVSQAEIANLKRLIGFYSTSAAGASFDTRRMVQSISAKVDAAARSAPTTFPPGFANLCGSYRPMFAPAGAISYR